MSRPFIPVNESFATWRQEPAYREAYEALEEEFALVRALIEARTKAGLTQTQVAQRIGRDHAGGHCPAGRRACTTVYQDLGALRPSHRDSPQNQL